MKKILSFVRIIYTFLIIFLVGAECEAQQTIINIPSTKVLKQGESYAKMSSRFRPFEPKDFTQLTPNLTHGIGYNTEIGIGVPVKIDENTEVKSDFAIKKRFHLSKHSIFAFGARISPYLDNASTPSNLTYALLSQQFKSTKFTAGMYVANKKSFLPDRPGVMLGLEQVIIRKKLNLAIDWMSRNESFGYLATGIKYNLAPTVTVTNAVLIPNGNKAKLGFTVSIGKYF